jgi:hypothetical protein
MGYLLCKTCVHRKSCVYRKGRKDVFQCEEFKGERPQQRKPAEREAAVSAER